MRALVLFMFLVGCKGQSGSAGATGAKGSNGTVALSSGFSCTKITGGLFFQYRSWTFSTGDVWVECEVAGTGGQGSQSNLYRADQSGATTFTCSAVFDTTDGTPSSGFWTFTGNAGKQALYTDAGSGANGTTVSFLVGNCSTF